MIYLVFNLEINNNVENLKPTLSRNIKENDKKLVDLPQTLMRLIVG